MKSITKLYEDQITKALKGTFKQLDVTDAFLGDRKIHLTALDRKLIKASIVNANQPVYTKEKKLEIISVEKDVVNAKLHSYEWNDNAMKKTWQSKKIKYQITG